MDGALTGGLTSTTPIVDAIATAPDPFDPSKIKFGRSIFGFFLSIFIIGATGAPVTRAQDWYIAKLRSGQVASADFPVPGATGVSSTRNQIFHEEKGLVGSGDGTAMVFKGVIKVPKGMQRMREGDQFFIKMRNADAAVDATFCIKAIFNSYG